MKGLSFSSLLMWMLSFIIVGRVVLICVIVNVIKCFVTEGTDILHVKPFTKTYAVKIMITFSNASTGQLLVTDRAHVVKVEELFLRRFGQ